MQRIVPLLFTCLVAVSLPAQAAPAETTIENVLRDRAQFEGRTVRLRGIVNQCSRFQCDICPHAAAGTEDCLKIADWRGKADPESFYDAWKAEQRELDQSYRFTEVVIEATVDFYTPAEQKADEEERAAAPEWVDFFPCLPGAKRMCLPEGGVRLTGARVVRRIARPGALAGPVTGSENPRLLPASPQVTADLREAYAKASGEPLAHRPNAAVVSEEEEKLAWLCVATGSRPPRGWPTNLGRTYATARDGFTCLLATNYSESGWTIRLDPEE